MFFKIARYLIIGRRKYGSFKNLKITTYFNIGGYKRFVKYGFSCFVDV